MAERKMPSASALIHYVEATNPIVTGLTDLGELFVTVNIRGACMLFFESPESLQVWAARLITGAEVVRYMRMAEEEKKEEEANG